MEAFGDGVGDRGMRVHEVSMLTINPADGLEAFGAIVHTENYARNSEHKTLLALPTIGQNAALLGAALLGISEGKAKTLLFRTRAGLKTFLQQEGYQV